MKRIMALLLTVCMMASLAACGSSGGSTSQGGTKAAAESGAAESATAESGAAEGGNGKELAAGLSTSPEKLRDLIRFFREKQRCCLFV